MRKAILLLLMLAGLAGCSVFRPYGRRYAPPVYYRELDIMVHSDQLKLHHQRSLHLLPDTLIKIRLLHPKGRSVVRIFKGRTLVCEWFYADGGDLEREPSQVFDRLRLHDYEDVVDHYIPIRDSTWRYYSAADGKPARVVIWKMGTLVSDQVIR